MFRRFIKFCFVLGAILFLLGAAGAGVTGFYFYHRYTRDLPQIDRLSDYTPKAVTSIYSEDGTLIGEVWDEERRYPVDFNEIPKLVRNAFLAAEDANFYSHPGVDIMSIFRAVYVNLRQKHTTQGASTITQQVVKSLLLSREKTFERKIKEAILAYRLEKRLTKDEIFSIYLNEIFLGATAYGVKAAAKVFFHKELKDLTVGEAAFLAGLPPRPSYLADARNREEAVGRQHYVLEQMTKNNYITPEMRDQALNTPLTIYPAELQKVFRAPYYTTHVAKLLEEQLGKRQMSVGGYEVRTMVDLKATEIAERAVRRGLQELDKRRGWRGPLARVESGEATDLLDSVIGESADELKPNQIYRALVREAKGGAIRLQVGKLTGVLNIKQSGWGNRFLDKHDNISGISLATYLKPGHVIEVSLSEPDEDKSDTKDKSKNEASKPKNEKSELMFKLDQTPAVEGAFVITNALTGAVKVIIGGYDYNRSVFNRATQGTRQPGSSFKPFIYLSSLQKLHYTPATLVPDSPISLTGGNGQVWSPQNFDGKFLGPITLRTALQRSRNVVSVFLITRVGVDKVIEVARALGITTPIPRELSISLGTPDVKLIEMVRAYGAFAAGGWLSDELIISSIRDRSGKVIYEKRPKQRQVIEEEDAFLMANMMKGVVERGTATLVKQLGKPVAGKTGTTNDHMDAWFIGYTPEWTAGAWTGYDVKRPMGKQETGGRAAAPIFLYFMQEFLANDPPLDFDPPEGVVPVPIDLASGRPTSPDDQNAFIEYFRVGTEPKEWGEDSAIPQDYLSSEEF